ncbi:M23 family metallopeptidase [Rhodococcus sp. KRD162]|uniref:M23 family metallopeptidase n=1 Tax=Rhodococcus sp. KRD162 TaxID=2729725 RepID=UPI0019D2FF58|nr:M23 family metallopeptidase [Rhodococcus sp. KRD162]
MGRRLHRVIAGSMLSAALCIGATGMVNPAVATAQPTIELPQIPIPQPDAQQRAAILSAVLDATGVLITQVAAIVLDGDTLSTPDAPSTTDLPAIELPIAPPTIGLGGAVLPIEAGKYRISSGYGGRNNPTGNGAQYHQGIDLAADSGTPIHAVTGGTVVQAGDAGDGYGKLVRIKSGNTETYYGHQSSIAVSVGDEVAPGDVLGAVGSTGNSTGPHLHFEVRNNGSSIEPTAYLKTLGIDPSLYQTRDRR